MLALRSSALCLLLAGVTCALAGCDTRPSEAGRLRTDIEPFLDEHARFDAWARRLDLAESAFRSREALVEAAFAPLRERPRVVAAWLIREGPGATELRYPPGGPSLPDDGWVRVVLPDHPLDEVQAQRCSLHVGDEDRPLVLVRRTRPATGGAMLSVTTAY
ncbi:MAG: hypothetical protein KC619_31305 [Myxococcales bacterium]|nr:hypothetical protein [Myxococcales bacterium]